MKDSEITYYEHLSAIAEQTGDYSEIEVEFPEIVRHVWDWYMDLHNGEGISYSEIMAWCALTGNKPTAWEISLIKKLNIAYRNKDG